MNKTFFSLKDQFLAQLEPLTTADMSKQPAYLLMNAMINHPDVKYPDAHRTVAGMSIVVSQDMVDDADLFKRTVDAYTKILNNIWAALQRDHGSRAYDMFPQIATRMSLTYTN